MMKKIMQFGMKNNNGALCIVLDITYIFSI